MAAEIERVRADLAVYEKQLIQLESENADLKQKLNKARDDNRNLRDSNRQLQAEVKSLKTTSVSTE